MTCTRRCVPCGWRRISIAESASALQLDGYPIWIHDAGYIVCSCSCASLTLHRVAAERSCSMLGRLQSLSCTAKNQLSTGLWSPAREHGASSLHPPTTMIATTQTYIHPPNLIHINIRPRALRLAPAPALPRKERINAARECPWAVSSILRLTYWETGHVGWLGSRYASPMRPCSLSPPSTETL